MSTHFVYGLLITHLSIPLSYVSTPIVKPYLVTTAISTVVEKFCKLSLENKQQIYHRFLLMWKIFPGPSPLKQKVVKVKATGEAAEDEPATEDDMPPNKSEFLHIYLNFLLALLYL